MLAWRSTALISAKRVDIWKTPVVLLRRAEERFKRLGRDDEVKQVQAALTTIDDAQRMAGKLDQSANSRAGDAAKLLADLLDAEATR